MMGETAKQDTTIAALILFRVFLGLAVSLITVPSSLMAKGGVYPMTKHGDPVAGVQRDPALPRGDCAQCHVAHDGSSPTPFTLSAPNANALCYTSGCHATSAANNIYQGQSLYDASGHATNTTMVWPGADPTVDSFAPPAKPTGDWGTCTNCHDPHGYNRDGTGLIPSLTFSREEKPCIVCHDGAPAGKDIKSEFNKAYRHPTTTISGKHDIGEDGTSSAYGALQDNRHAECVDCHNPHIAKGGFSPPFPPDASERIRGVGRVEVLNGGAGFAPTYTYRGPSDTIPAPKEYEVCFKCHSSWTTQPAGQPDLALLFNGNNPSYHPVEAQGKNLNINLNSFVNNWDATKLMYCSDCHASDDPNVAGPHGSQHPYILKKDYTASSSSRTMSSDEICFECHRYDTYANKEASNTIQGYSRFNRPAFEKGHAFHLDEKQYPCYACHDSHGSTTRPHLIVTGRNPGLNDYTESPNGGTCYPTCHGAETYTINYPR
jgi:predicted CXXCH cytochrome family protein